MKKKIMLVLVMSVSFMPAAFATEPGMLTGQATRNSELNPASLACTRKYVDKSKIAAQPNAGTSGTADSSDGR